jgi:MOSC domain-containing protein YiiM
MPRLLSVNVGLPRDIPWRGKTIHTAVWKTPVQGRRMVRRLNIDGDGQGDLAGHGGEHRAVFVYQIDSYYYWQSQLGRNDFTYGQFGENFTVDGLSDREVCVGDRYRIGGALFEVTQPRVTCYRVGVRRTGINLIDLQQIAARLTQRGRETMVRVLTGTALHFRNFAHGRRHILSPDLLGDIDALIGDILVVGSGPDRIKGLAAIVGLRRDLYPDAAPYGPSPLSVDGTG